MSRLPRYGRGSLVPHLIASALLLAGGLIGAGSDDIVVASQPRHVRFDASGEPSDTGRVTTYARLDTASPGTRTFLAPNYPNPFSVDNGTTIEFSLATDAQVTLTVYDFWYNVVEELIVNESLAAGVVYRRKFPRNSPPDMVLFSGMYFYTLKVGDEIHQRRMMLMK